ncbi:type II toxin-antitoxin system VapC family toxin [Actinophytocola sp.]|uniref:type II toxin-antitoxin system VapC family toxin n=1 Tax=Actinophytocola sp. TaxID=1872138 RepID=UPI002DBF4D17|nr:type II toxin-antitoxin system VapC family toxin [Actinophytocola sp.]
MNDLVTDASVLVCMLTGTTHTAAGLTDRLGESWCHAPHVVDAEVGHALRRKERNGELDSHRALTALRCLDRTIDERYPHTSPMIEMAWLQRERLTFYDALYVSLAAMLQVPLLTLDARLARCHDLPCEVELIIDN